VAAKGSHHGETGLEGGPEMGGSGHRVRVVDVIGFDPDADEFTHEVGHNGRCVVYTS